MNRRAGRLFELLLRRSAEAAWTASVVVAVACGRPGSSASGASAAVVDSASPGSAGTKGSDSAPSGAASGAPAEGQSRRAPISERWAVGPAALEKALSAKGPVLLYVSSEWCPPCRALAANLLSTKAFSDATRGWALIEIDGDDPGAQAIAERFEARAYPTLLLLDESGQEVFRAHHAITLAEIAPALASASTAGKGFRDALARVDRGAATPEDCALLAAVDWSPASGMALRTEERLAALRRAFEQCGAPNSAAGNKAAAGEKAPPGNKAAAGEKASPVRALFAAQLLGLAATADDVADSALPGAAIKPMAGALLDAVFLNDESAFAARTLITTWANPVVRWLFGGERGGEFRALRDRWLRAARAIRGRAGVSLDMQLLGYDAELDFHRLEFGDSAPVPPALHDEVVAATGRVLDLARTPSERHAVVSNAAYLLRSVGERGRARDLLTKEVDSTDAPSYYLTTLSQWALRDGDRAEARRYARSAVERARGRASRLQWMIDELALHSATDPADRATILARASEAYALLFAEQDAFLGRNQPRAARLRDMLSPLAGDPSVLAFVAAYSPKCASLPADSRSRCDEHFLALATRPHDR